MAATFLNLDLSFDRAAIMRSAWAQARVDLARNTRAGIPCTLRSCFADALRSKWDIARGVRATRLWRIERAAEEKRRLTLVPIERERLELFDARIIARHIDSFAAMISTVDAIDARLKVLAAA